DGAYRFIIGRRGCRAETICPARPPRVSFKDRLPSPSLPLPEVLPVTRSTRRSFLKTTLATAATVTVAGTKSSARVLGANDTIRIAVAGLNGRGGSHVDAFGKMDKVEIAYLVDPDQRTYKKRLASIKGTAPTCVQDIRKALEDKTLDAVSIATPNHWHAL